MFRVDSKQTVLDHLSGKIGSKAGDALLTSAAKSIVERPIEPTLSAAVIVGLAQAFEAAFLIALGLGIYWSYVQGGMDNFYVPAILGATALANVLFNTAQCHSIRAYRTLAKQTGRALAAWSLVFVTLTTVIFAFKAHDQISRVWTISWYATGAVSIVLFRLSLRSLVQHWTETGRLKRRTVIVGGGKDAEELVEAIRTSAEGDIELYGLFDDRVDERSPEMVAGCPKLGPVSALPEFARRTKLDLVLVSMPLSAEKRLLEMLKQLWVLPVDIRLSAHMSKLKFTAKSYSYVGDLPVFEMADRPISDWNLVFKWLFDKLVAVSALIILSPVMLAIALAVKLDSKGPVLFRQKRHGFNNELIDIYKFRSMYTAQSDVKATKLVTKDDPRVTRVGRFIRKSSLDELPQLFNVLKGELSIVGPRPHALEAKAANTLYYDAVEGYFARHRVKPGITGWAQIHGWRGETDSVEKIMKRVHYDLYYIENWSIFLDLYILFMTPFSLVSQRENAY